MKANNWNIDRMRLVNTNVTCQSLCMHRTARTRRSAHMNFAEMSKYPIRDLIVYCSKLRRKPVKGDGQKWERKKVSDKRKHLIDIERAKKTRSCAE